MDEAPTLTYLGRYVWSIDDGRFGGWSGLEIDPGGTEFTAVSDHGFIVFGTLVRREGRIAEVVSTRVMTLPLGDGVEKTERTRDAEGLAIAPSGERFVAFERLHRIARYWRGSAWPELLPGAEEFQRLQGNSGIEALAYGRDGALYAVPERSGRKDRPFPVFRWQDGAWTIPFAIPRRGLFLPVGADVGPDGRLYLLERVYHAFLGFQSRVRRFEIAGGELRGEETLLVSEIGQHDNLEGLAVWADRAGAVRLTMISDDNYRWLQPTEWVEYRLDERVAPAPVGR